MARKKKKRNSRSATKLPSEAQLLSSKRNGVLVAMLARHRGTGRMVKRNKKRSKDRKNSWRRDHGLD